MAEGKNKLVLVEIAIEWLCQEFTRQIAQEARRLEGVEANFSTEVRRIAQELASKRITDQIKTDQIAVQRFLAIFEEKEKSDEDDLSATKVIDLRTLTDDHQPGVFLH